jgi:hypothetical protein
MTLEEIYDYWEPFHSKDTIKREELTEDCQMYYIVAQTLAKSSSSMTLFVASEANYDRSKIFELIDKLNKPTKLAEYLHIKFDDEKDKLNMLLAAVAADKLMEEE